MSEEKVVLEETLKSNVPVMEDYGAKNKEPIEEAEMSTYDKVMWEIRQLSLDEQSQVIHSLLHERANALNNMRERNFGFLNHINL